MRSGFWAACLMSLFAGGLAAGCGDSDVGDACDDPGTRDECAEGAICTNEEGGGVCRALCSEQSDCPEGENCNGVTGTDQKSCQPGD